MIEWIILGCVLVGAYIVARKKMQNKVIYQSNKTYSGFKNIFSKSCKKPC